MKQCPQCQQTYSDDTIFCLSDGTPLVFFDDAPEEVTVFKPHQEDLTVIRSAQNIQPPVQPPVIQNVQQGVSPIFAYLSIGLFLLLLAGGVILLGIFAISSMWDSKKVATDLKNSNTQLVENRQNDVNAQQANLRELQDQLAKEKQKIENERKRLEEEKNKTFQTPTPLPTAMPTTMPTIMPTPPPITYPAQPTARIKFGRGRVAESVSGKVYTQRSFVLEARSGQFLSASVSGGNCVTFSNGSTSIGYATGNGDNRLTIINKCDSEAAFKLTVSIR